MTNHCGSMRIMSVICSGVGARDTFVSNKLTKFGICDRTLLNAELQTAEFLKFLILLEEQASYQSYLIGCKSGQQ